MNFFHGSMIFIVDTVKGQVYALIVARDAINQPRRWAVTGGKAMGEKSERKRQQHCSDCGAWIGDTRSNRNEAVCVECASVRRVGRNAKKSAKGVSVAIHSSLMPLLVEIADDMRGVGEYTVDIQTNAERIVVTWVSLIGDTVSLIGETVTEIWNF